MKKHCKHEPFLKGTKWISRAGDIEVVIDNIHFKESTKEILVGYNGGHYSMHIHAFVESFKPNREASKGKYLTGLLGETITADCVADTTIDQAQRLAVERGHDMIYERNGLVYGHLIVHKVVSENVGGAGWRTVE